MSESRSLKTEIKVQLRPATTGDMKDLWMWRNDEVTRANSLSSDHVPWCRHAEWFWGMLGSYDQKVMIAESYGTAVGTIRLDYGVDGVKLNWTVAPEFRNQGFGRAIVAAAIRWEPNKLLVAWVKPHNTQSLKIAESLGFVEESRSSLVIVLTRKPN